MQEVISLHARLSKGFHGGHSERSFQEVTFFGGESQVSPSWVSEKDHAVSFPSCDANVSQLEAFQRKLQPIWDARAQGCKMPQQAKKC